MAQLSLISVNLATVALESLLFGIFLSLSTAFLYLHLSYAAGRDRSSRTASSIPSIQWARRNLSLMFIGAVCITFTITAHWILTVVRLFDAFVHFEGGAAPTLYYSDLAQTTEVVKTAFVIATLVIADILFTYRLWVVWGYNHYIAVLPLCSVAGLFVAGVGIIHELAHMAEGRTVFISQANEWISAAYSFTFITNVYCSALIASKVWRASHRSEKAYGGGSLMRVFSTIIESAFIYMTYTVFFFIAYQADSNLQYTCIDTLCPISGIAFMLINVRVGLGWAEHAHVQPPRPMRPAFPMRPVAVDITRIVQKEDDMGRPVAVKADFESEV
ncbi:hypothetical protein WOLCODRAFT_138817 [Wolfiporia cocos MD-104 SS10]|uniref:Uncharacterized protein n=1 Tax=Wolfiporia cocos (strain MD-104) TaxID=742152 RepID=A0A2H3JRS7_WOLCO|nr:hypothetical protein WOLCODRAFT_138817 [Wolfiporia cocos MD-104 SS10]